MGVWVKGTRYGDSGKRHYYESDDIDWYWEPLSSNIDAGISWTEYMTGRSLCGKIGGGHAGTGRAYWSDWKNRLVVDRGLSLKDESAVKLTQANLCHYCKTKYINARPELKEALEALGVY